MCTRNRFKPSLDFVIQGYSSIQVGKSGGCATFVKNEIKYSRLQQS